MKKLILLLAIYIFSGVAYAQQITPPQQINQQDNVTPIATIDNSYIAVSQQTNGTVYQETQTSCSDLNQQLNTLTTQGSNLTGEINGLTTRLTNDNNQAQQIANQIQDISSELSAAGC